MTTKPTMEKNERRRLNNSRSAKRSRFRRDFPKRLFRLFYAIKLLPPEEMNHYANAIRAKADDFLLELGANK